jgi:hypothetical protein
MLAEERALTSGLAGIDVLAATDEHVLQQGLARSARLYVPFTNEATDPRCCDEGYPDRPGRASNKEGESWVIITKPSSESIRQNHVMQ